MKAQSLIKRLPWPGWLSVAVVVGLLTVLNQLWTPNQALQLSPTTYGESLSGFGALYQTLEKLGVEPQRSRRYYSSIDHSRPLWLLAPPFRARPKDADDAAEEKTHDKQPEELRDRLLKQLEAWVRAGGTAVVLFRSELEPEWLGRLGLRAETTEGNTFVVEGPLARGKRTLKWDPERISIKDGVHSEQPALHIRAEDEGGLPAHSRARAVLWTGSDEERAILGVEVPQEKGRMVLVAGERFLDNAQLAVADNALLASDLIAMYGAPRFDERSHGLWPEASVVQALGTWRLLLLSLGVVVLPVLWLWSQRVTPERELPPPSELDPSLGRFVDSLAVLYRKHAGRYAAEQYMAYRKAWEHRHGRSEVALPSPLPQSEAALLEAVRLLEQAPQASRRLPTVRSPQGGGSVPQSRHG